MSLSDRELEYYAVKCGNTVMNGVILQNWSTFMGSENITCDYLYCSFVDEDNAMFIFKNNDKYVSVINKEENHVIEFFDSFGSAVAFNDSKLLGLHNIKLSSSLQKDLQQLVCIDFIALEDEEYKEKFLQYLMQYNDCLNIDMFQNLSDEVLEDVLKKFENCNSIKSVFLNFNTNIKTLTWLSYFENLENIKICSCNNIGDENFKEIKSIKKISLQSCINVTLTAFTHLLKMENIECVEFINANMFCGEKPLCPCVTQHQWSLLFDEPGSKSIKDLYIDSNYLTRDIMHDIIKTCRNLKIFIVCEHLYLTVINDVREGYNKEETLTIRNSNNGDFKDFRKEVSIARLLRDKIEKPFSDSMLRVIQKHKNKK
jgi:hypothetical protein